MATIIKLKRGTSTPTTSDLGVGEVGIDTSQEVLYKRLRNNQRNWWYK